MEYKLSEDDLLPCPFCSGRAEFVRRGTGRQSCQVACTECGCSMETGETWQSGLAWNTRNRDPRIDDALDMILHHGGYDGGHHKHWVLDQVVRILTGCQPVPREAIDVNGKTYSYLALGESEGYLEWVKSYCQGPDGPDDYEWDTGVPP